MPGTIKRTPRRGGPSKTPEKATGSPAKFYSPKTPGWVSGSQMTFDNDDSPVNKVHKGRRSVMPTGKTFQKPTNSRRHTLFKFPEPVRSSPIGTRSRRSSIFNVESRKGGIRLTIAVTPQEKPKKGPGKVLSPPGVTTRTRRSSVYQKGKTLQQACSQTQKVSVTDKNKLTAKKDTAIPKKTAVKRRSVCPKSPPSRPSSRTSQTADVSISQSVKGPATKRRSVQPNTVKSTTEDVNSPAEKKMKKTPRRSVSKSIEAEEPKNLPENVDNPVFKTPVRPVSSVSEDTQSVSTRKLRSAKKTPAPKVTKSLNDVKQNTPKNSSISKTPQSKRKTPAQSASKKLRSAAKSKSETPAVSRSTRKRKVEQPEADVTDSETQQMNMKAVQKNQVTLSPEMSKKDESPKFTEVKQKIDLTEKLDTPQVKKVRMTPAVSDTTERKSRQSYRKTPAKLKGGDAVNAEDDSFDESVEFKTPMKTPRVMKSAKKTNTSEAVSKTPQVLLTKLPVTNEETKMETCKEEKHQKSVQVLSPPLSSPVDHNEKLAERKCTPARVQPDAVKKEGKGKIKKESKVKKLKSKEKENAATMSLNGTLNTSAHTSVGAKCTIL